LKAFTSLAMFLLGHTAADSVDTQTAHRGPRELQAQAELQAILTKYDLRKYLFTRRVVFDRDATNHAFPVLTLNVRFAGSEDELLSSFLHEQLHWWLRNHPNEMERALRQLRRLYPQVPVGLPDGADTEYSTYGHLVDCYLEIRADRRLIGETRTLEVIERKPWYTWIYRTILQDESKIAAIVAAEHLNAD
jgi:hypothetical protein